MMKPLNTRKVATHSLMNGFERSVVPKPLVNSAKLRVSAATAASTAHRRVRMPPAACRNRSRRKIAGRTPTTIVTMPMPIARPAAPATWFGEPLLVRHDPQEPRRDEVGELPDEVLHAHEARALVVVGGELVAQRHPRRREDGVGEVEEDRAAEEVPEVERLAAAPPGSCQSSGVDDARRRSRRRRCTGAAAPSASGCCRRCSPSADR